MCVFNQKKSLSSFQLLVSTKKSEALMRMRRLWNILKRNFLVSHCISFHSYHHIFVYIFVKPSYMKIIRNKNNTLKRYFFACLSLHGGEKRVTMKAFQSTRMTRNCTNIYSHICVNDFISH